MSFGRTLKKILSRALGSMTLSFAMVALMSRASGNWFVSDQSPKNVNYFMSESHTVRQAIDPGRPCKLARDNDMMYQLGDYLDASVVE